MQIIERIMKILNSFSFEESELGLNDLALKTALPKPTVFRIAEALCTEKILNKNEKNSKYRIGVKLFEIGSLYIQTMELRLLAFPEMEKLHEKTGEAVHMGIIEGDEVISIEGLESIHHLQTRLWVGKRSPIYCTSIGKVILAFLSPEKKKKIYTNLKFRKYTKNTITDFQSLDLELEKIRREKTAVDIEEHDEGITCIGAPVFGGSGEVLASISISGPSIRMTSEILTKYRECLILAVENISRKLSNKYV